MKNIDGSRANRIIIPLAVVIGFGLAWVLSLALPLRLLDFEHYDQAARLLWQGQNPYGAIEFFAPPWMALLLAPLLLLPLKLASAVWIVLSLAAMGAMTVLAQQLTGLPRRSWARQASLILMLLTPAALFVYITGQVSALVTLAVLVAAAELMRPQPAARGWVIAIGAVVASLKPNIIWLPAALIALEVVRRRNWRALAWCALVLGALAAISFLWLPTWPRALLAAWRGGDYLGGVGLVAPGYIGLAQLGVPVWLFVPFIIYLFVYWWREGLSVRVLALALALCLLVTPYSRGYDDVVLILPSLASLALPGGRRWLGLALVIAGWVAPVLGVVVLAPVFVSIAVLLAFQTLITVPH